MQFFAVATLQQPQDMAGILLGVAAIITAGGGVYAIIKKKDDNTDVANRSAIAVSQVTETAGKVDTLISIVAELRDQLNTLQRQRDIDAQKIIQLKNELDNEVVRHNGTRAELLKTQRDLAEAQAAIIVKDEKIASLQAQLDSLTKKRNTKGEKKRRGENVS